MQSFHIRYRNTQGTLMRILNAASRRALDLPVVQAEPAEHDHQVTLALDVNQKQVGQLYREWYAIADVIKVSSGAAQAANTPGTPVSALLILRTVPVLAAISLNRSMAAMPPVRSSSRLISSKPRINSRTPA